MGGRCGCGVEVAEGMTVAVRVEVLVEVIVAVAAGGIAGGGGAEQEATSRRSNGMRRRIIRLYLCRCERSEAVSLFR
jgi:hypothetical protein